MSANPRFSGITGAEPFSSSFSSKSSIQAADTRTDTHAEAHSVINIDKGRRNSGAISQWSGCAAKRVFDLTCVLLALPIIVPTFLLIGLAVRLTSRGPVLFRQQRMGRHGRVFTIFKFRTMPIRRKATERPAVTTSSNQQFTPVGPFLRRWKLDELPQLINVVRGEMSLVGPRPKLPKHQNSYLQCRPGLTGGATIVFAREEVALSSVPSSHLDSYYHSVVLPAKQRLDDEYMARSTFRSDLRLILKSVFRSWDDVALAELPPLQPAAAKHAAHTHVSIAEHAPIHPHAEPVPPAISFALREIGD